MEDTEEKTKKKTDSRKFVVWLAYTVLTFCVIAVCCVVMFVTKEVNDKIVDAMIKMITAYGWISGVYIGVNGGQKVGFAIADSLKTEENQ